MTSFYSLQKVVSGVVNTVQQVGKALGICSPLNNDLIQLMLGLEFPMN